MAKPKTSIEEAFQARYIVDGLTGCWIWIGDKDKNGYGIWQLKKVPLGNGRYERKRIRVSRYSYEVHKGPIPPDMRVLHSCDNPPCVNPDHLSLGTPKDNSEEMVERCRNQRGETRWNAKLCDEAVIAIRQSDATLEELAQLYGVSFQSVSDAKNGRTWTHLPLGLRSGVDNRARFGIKNGSSKLDEDKVRAIREDRGSNISIALKFGISDVLVGKIKSRLIWRHVP